MKYTSLLIFITIILFSAAGLAGCSQDNQAKATANEPKPAGAKPISVTMYKNPNCQCCERWAAYMEKNGYSVKVIPSDTLAAVKDKYGVPGNVRSCHTALIDGYIVEGHVPVEAINKLLKNNVDATGIAVPGMPTGAPGTKGKRTAVDVYLFKGQDQEAYYGKY